MHSNNNTSNDVTSVSLVDPLFPCTRTWQAHADPKRNVGDIVDIGDTICVVVDKTISIDGRFVTYHFSPADEL